MGRKHCASKLNQPAVGATTLQQSSDRPYDNSPPRTPPAQIGRPGKPRGVNAPRTRPSLHDAFGEEMNEGKGQHNRQRSSSHELSWSPKNARHSIVDNMLLSLDSFGGGVGSSRGTTPLSSQDMQYATLQRLGSSNSRPRGHTTSSSVSSDYSLHVESPNSGHTRGHRSNSGTNFQSSLGRIDSVRLAEDGKGRNTGLRELVNGQQRAFSGQETSRKSGRNSTSSSLDAGRAVGGMSRQPLAPSRSSASFDNGYQRPELANNTQSSAPIQDSYSYRDTDAAPTPTVPAGPRTDSSPARSARFRPGSSLSNSQTLPPRRRGSIRTPITLFGRNDRLDLPENQSSRYHQELAKENHHSTNSSAQNPSTPMKSYDSPSAAATATLTAKENQRPGFFKRVFGSSRGTSSAINDSTMPRKTANSQNSTRTTSRTSSLPIDRNASTLSADPSPQQAHSQKSAGKDKSSKETPTLNKKTSFFRRRRKSIQDNVPLPQHTSLVEPDSNSDWHDPIPPPRSPYEKGPDSPSSLRRVMNPYLNGQKKSESMNNSNHNNNTAGSRVTPTSTAYSTIRTVTTTNTVSTPTVTTVLKSVSAPAEMEPPTNDRPSMNGGRDSFGEGRTIAGQTPNRPSDEITRHSPSHTRTQSDIDKDLPRLPVDYNAMAYDSKLEDAVSDGKIAKKQDASRRRTTSTTSKHDRDNSETSQTLPERSSSRQLPELSTQTEFRASREAPTHNSDSIAEDYKSANSKPVSPVVDGPVYGGLPDTDLADETLEAISFPTTDPCEPLAEHRSFAEKLFAGTAGIDRSETAPWLGEAGSDRSRIRRAYMELFDWKDLSILGALRGFCSSVQLKGETQQVDRVLDAISTRWCDCNPNHGFKATGKLSPEHL